MAPGGAGGHTSRVAVLPLSDSAKYPPLPHHRRGPAVRAKDQESEEEMRISTRRLLITEEDRRHETRIPEFDEAGGWSGIFPDPDAPLAVEIGFGKDTHILDQAEAHPDRNFVAFEYQRKKFDKVLKKITRRGGLPNLRLVHADVTNSWDHLFAPESLAHVYVFFPDPWPKARHHGRRTLNPEFTARIAARLAPGAPLEVRTDNVEYVEQIVEVLDGEASLENEVAPAPWLHDPIPLPEGSPRRHIPTLFESKFREQGLPIHYFYRRKRG